MRFPSEAKDNGRRRRGGGDTRSRSNGSTVSRYFISGEIGGRAKAAGRPICKHKRGSPGMKLARLAGGWLPLFRYSGGAGRENGRITVRFVNQTLA